MLQAEDNLTPTLNTPAPPILHRLIVYTNSWVMTIEYDEEPQK
ncbi:hypothetical protein ACFTAO_12935 [Paenibacillus rhizoplanae]